MKFHNTTSSVATFALAALFIAVGAGSEIAQAHVSLEVKQARAGAGYKATLKVPHGCEGSATRRIEVKIPEGVIAVKPMPKPGWSIVTTKGPYAKSYDFYHGAKLSEGVVSLAWEGGLLSDEHYDEFVFSAFVAGSLPAGSTIYFPVVQQCEKGEISWVEVPGAGQDAHSLKYPAASLKLIAATTAAAHAPAVFTVKDIEITAPWARATPGGAKVAAGYLAIKNNGTVGDTLIGGTLASAGRVEIHEVVAADGVMKMRELQKGLEIAPGATVELKPGGYHLMFVELAGAFKEGERIKGTLVFEKAGKVDIEFTVGAVGAPSSGHSHH